MAAWREERELRIAFEKRTSTAAFEIEVIEFEDDGELLGHEGLTVSAVRVEHAPIPHAFGFVFEAVGRKAVLSGDTKRCEALIEAAKGADVIVHEVFDHGRDPVPRGTQSPETMGQVASYHTLSTEVGEIAKAAGAGALILTHIVPPSADPARLIQHARAGFDGFVAVGEDLMAIDVINRHVSWRGMSVGF
jgi:ribonuclease Z